MKICAYLRKRKDKGERYVHIFERYDQYLRRYVVYLSPLSFRFLRYTTYLHWGRYYGVFGLTRSVRRRGRPGLQMLSTGLGHLCPSNCPHGTSAATTHQPPWHTSRHDTPATTASAMTHQPAACADGCPTRATCCDNRQTMRVVSCACRRSPLTSSRLVSRSMASRRTSPCASLP